MHEVTDIQYKYFPENCWLWRGGHFIQSIILCSSKDSNLAITFLNKANMENVLTTVSWNLKFCIVINLC